MWGGNKYQFTAQPRPSFHVLEVADPFLGGAPADGALTVVATPVHGAPLAGDVVHPSIGAALADGVSGIAADMGAAFAAAHSEGMAAPEDAAGAPLSENGSPPLPVPKDPPPLPPPMDPPLLDLPQVPLPDLDEYLTVPDVDALEELQTWKDNGEDAPDAETLPAACEWQMVPVPEPVRDRPAERATQKIFRLLIDLARTIGSERQYVGFSAFVLFALAYMCKSVMWVSDQPWDMVEMFVPEQFRPECQTECG